MQAADPVLHVEAGALPLLELMKLYYDRKAPAERIATALSAPVAERARQGPAGALRPPQDATI